MINMGNDVSFSLNFVFRLIRRKEKTIKDSNGKLTVVVHPSSIIKKCLLSGFNLIGDRVALHNCCLGYGTYVNMDTVLFDTFIGKYSSISSNVHIINGVHPSGFVSTYPGFYSNKHYGIKTYSDDVYFKEYSDKKFEGVYSTYIGSDVLIGSGAVLMEGIVIGDGAIVLPYAVVTHDVEPYSVVGGVPAKIVKYRFEEKDREFLLNFKWWDRDERWLKQHWKLILNLEELENYDGLD